MQPAGIGLLPKVPPSDPLPEVTIAKSLGLHARILRKCYYFCNTTTPIDIKPSHVLHMVGTRLRAKFCHRTTRRLGGDRPQTK